MNEIESLSLSKQQQKLKKNKRNLRFNSFEQRNTAKIHEILNEFAYVFVRMIILLNLAAFVTQQTTFEKTNFFFFIALSVYNHQRKCHLVGLSLISKNFG